MDNHFKTELRSLLILSMVLVFLSACAIRPTLLPEGRPVEQVTSFDFDGRMSIRQGEEITTGKVNWRHTEANDTVEFFTPFGQQVALIDRQGNRYRIEQGGKLITETEQIESVLLERWGWSLPIRDLPSWALGIPAISQLNAQVPLPYEMTIPEGWTVRYERYESINGRLLPSLMIFSNEDLSIRLVIDRWQIPL